MDHYDEVNQKLEVLYESMIDNFDDLKSSLKTLIANPEKIKNTNKFASLIRDLNEPALIEPLLYSISGASKGDAWLCDFLYAAISLLDDANEEDEFETPEILVDKLSIWVLESTGELAWKAAGLLKFSYSERAKKIQLKKLEQYGDFFLTYVECILGLIWCDPSKYMDLVRLIAEDTARDEKLREFCYGIIEKYT
jgi:hypothetical protein